MEATSHRTQDRAQEVITSGHPSSLYVAPPPGLVTEPLSGEDLGKLINSIQSNMFRLETLPQYLWDGEATRLKAYLNGQLEVQSSDALDAWCKGIEDHREHGRVVSRVHVLPPVLTPYLRYEIEWGYCTTAPAGEDIRLRILPDYDYWRTKFSVPDFWIFDDKDVVIMKYTEDGTYLHGERLMSTEHLPYFKGIKDAVTTDTISLSEVLALMRTGELR